MCDYIPDEEDCLKILKKNNVPQNIVKHSLKVKELALQIADALERRGIKVNKKLIIAASLLHDLDKIETLDKPLMHGKLAAKKLKALGMHSIADIVAVHVPQAILEGKLKTLEQKIVFYADKRVNNDKIVTLDERLRYAKERYCLNDERCIKFFEEVFEKTKQLEVELLGEQAINNSN